jgi:membrane protease YdiL (CAAX protease family)
MSLMSLPTVTTLNINMTVYRLVAGLTILVVLSSQCIVPSRAFSPFVPLSSRKTQSHSCQGTVSSRAIQRPAFTQSIFPSPQQWCPTSTGSSQRLRQSLILLRDSPESSSNGSEQDTPESSVSNESDSDSDSDSEKDAFFDGRTTAALVGGQSLLIVAAVIAALILNVPNYGLGPGISFTFETVSTGTLLALPLGVFAASLDLIEDKVPALKDVSTATQRSILSLMGSTFKPVLGLLIATALGLAAGIGEEMLFRGVLQYELAERWGPIVGVGIASVIFGALHAVTPLYAGLAGVASVYFGALYLSFDNLAIPICAHAVYDVCALLYAHFEVSQLTDKERDALANWEGPE